MSTSPLRCAVIGLGMGRAHADAYHSMPDAKLVAVADLDANRLAGMAPKIGADNCYTDFKKMLKTVKPDLVSVALPNAMHAPVTLAALKAGAHVLCEKPMAMNVRQAQLMRDTAIKAKRKLGINLSYRFTPQARALKDLADDGFLGTAYHADTVWTRRDGFPGFGSWFGQKALSGGGPLIDLGVHRIDLAMWLMGEPEPVTVSCSTHHLIGVPRAKAQGKKFDVEDLATGFIRYKNGVTMTIQISWGNHQAKNEHMVTTVMGTEGTLVHRNDERGSYDFVGECFRTFKGHRLNTTVASANPSIRSSYTEMVHAVLHDHTPLADANAGIRVQRILDGLYRSAKLKREVRV